jgi:hypothetical protein
LRESGKWSIGDGYGFAIEGLPTGSDVRILKLHGSINWLAVLFRGITRGPFALTRGGAFSSRPALGSDDLVALGYPDLVDPFLRGGAAAVPPLILPTSRKDFFFETNLGREWEEFWMHLWTTARDALQTSDRIVICGYGMYPIDKRGRDLILEGELTSEFEVCCGKDSARIVQELRDHGRNAHPAEQDFFETWVAAQ